MLFGLFHYLPFCVVFLLIRALNVHWPRQTDTPIANYSVLIKKKSQQHKQQNETQRFQQLSNFYSIRIGRNRHQAIDFSTMLKSSSGPVGYSTRSLILLCFILKQFLHAIDNTWQLQIYVWPLSQTKYYCKYIVHTNVSKQILYTARPIWISPGNLTVS